MAHDPRLLETSLSRLPLIIGQTQPVLVARVQAVPVFGLLALLTSPGMPLMQRLTAVAARAEYEQIALGPRQLWCLLDGNDMVAVKRPDDLLADRALVLQPYLYCDYDGRRHSH